MGAAIRIAFAPLFRWLGGALGWLLGADLIAALLRWCASLFCGMAGFVAVKSLLGTVGSVAYIAYLYSLLPKPVFWMATVTGLDVGLTMVITAYVCKWLFKKIEESCKSYLATQIGPPKP